jgi:hypothetical protein
MKFRAIVQQSGKTATGIQVPADVVESLGAGKRPKVSATINGYTYRSSVATLDGAFMLSVSADVRAHAGIAAGDEVEIDLELDTAPREVTVPPDFAAALDQDAEAKQIFEKLSYSHQQQHVLAIEGAKTAETRQRRIVKALSLLHESKA